MIAGPSPGASAGTFSSGGGASSVFSTFRAIPARFGTSESAASYSSREIIRAATIRRRIRSDRFITRSIFRYGL